MSMLIDHFDYIIIEGTHESSTFPGRCFRTNPSDSVVVFLVDDESIHSNTDGWISSFGYSKKRILIII